MTFFNGKFTQQNSFGHVFRFRLTPKRAGKLVIPAPTATIDGKTVSGRALSLNVITPEAQDLVVPEIKTDREKVYPTQPFEVTVRVLVRPLPDDPDRDPLGPLRRRPPHIEVNWVDLPAGLTGDDKARWLQKLLAEDGIGFTLNDVATRSGAFSLFDGPRAAVFNLYQGRESRKGMDGRPVNYFVYELNASAHCREGGNVYTRPGDCERVVRGRNGRQHLHRPASGRGRPGSDGGGGAKSRRRGPRPSAAGSAITGWRRPPVPPHYAWVTRSRSRSTSSAGNPADRST